MNMKQRQHLSQEYSKLMQLCLNEAYSLPYNHGNQRLYAIATDKRGKILAQSSNSYAKSHVMQAHYSTLSGNPYKIYLHAEIATLVKCRKKPYRLYVARAALGSSKPCPICMLAIRDSSVRSIHYIDNDLHEVKYEIR